MPQRHDRRRLLFADETDASAEDSDGLEAGSSRRRASSGLGPRSRDAIALLPSRPLVIGLVICGLLALVVSLAMAHRSIVPFVGDAGDRHLAALDLGVPASVGNWFASMLLGLESLVALCIYSLRRHRVDDYHGRYRVWLWMAVCCLVGSLGASADVVPVARAVAQRLAGLTLVPEVVFWPTLPAALGAMVLVRLLIEVRKSRLALTALLMSVTCVLFGVVAAGESASSIFVAGVLVSRAAILVGEVALLAAFLLYARRVTLELEGRIFAAPAKHKREAALVAKGVPASQPATEPSASAPRLRVDMAEDSPPAAHNLSRAERRRLRREGRKAA